MRLENSFEVAVPAEDAWALLLDVPRVIPCMPGAELVDAVDDATWKARMRVKLGPISLTFLTDVTRETIDEAAHRITLAATAREERGRGGAKATIESSLAAVGGGTQVNTITELTLSGSVAQYGRGIMQDVAAQLLKQFAACLERQLTEQPSAASVVSDSATEPPSASADPREPTPTAVPISGVKLLAAVLKARLSHLWKRLSRRGDRDPPTQR